MPETVVLLCLGGAAGIVVTLVLVIPLVRRQRLRAAHTAARALAAVQAGLKAVQAELDEAKRKPADDFAAFEARLARAQREIAVRDAALDQAMLRADRLERRFSALRAVLTDESEPPELAAVVPPQRPVADHFAAVETATGALMGEDSVPAATAASLPQQPLRPANPLSEVEALLSQMQAEDRTE